MKVGSRKPTATSSTTKLGSTSSTQSTGNAYKAASLYSAADSAPDQVSIQSQSAELLSLEAQMADISVVDVARVDAIKNAIAQGQFNVDAERVADRLLEVAREHLLHSPERR